MAKYSDEQRAEALAALEANGGNLSRTSRDTGIPIKTLSDWRDSPRGVADGVAELRNQKKADLADRLEALAHRVVDCLPDKLDAASAKDAAVVLGIALEKMRLLREQPTAITKDDGLTDDQRAERVAELLESARARRAGHAAATPAVH